MKTLCKYLFVLLIISKVGTAQTTLFSDNFESYATSYNLTTTSAGWRMATFTAGSNVWRITTACPIAGARSLTVRDNVTPANCSYFKTGSCDIVAYNATAFSTVGYCNLQWSFDYKVNGEVISGTVYDYLNLMYSIDGVTWQPMTQFYYSQTTTASATVTLPAACNNQLTVYIGYEWVNDASGGNDVPANVDNVVVKGTATAAPGNDVCSSAQVMTFAGTTATVSGNSCGATADLTTLKCFSTDVTRQNVWYKFVAPATANYYVSIIAGTMTYPIFGIYSFGTACSAATATNVSCYYYNLSAYNVGSACSLVSGQTYYVNVDVDGAIGTSGTFSLTIQKAITNDLITTPANINTCGANFSSSTIGATHCGDGGTNWANVDNNNATGTYTPTGADVGFIVDNNSWYNFCNGAAGTATFVVTMTNTGGCTGTNGLQLAAFTGNASSLTLVSGGTANMNIASGASFTTGNIVLASGACAYVMMDGNSGTNCNYNLVVTANPTCTLLEFSTLYFDGYADKTDNILKWATESENGSDKFIIEKSSNAQEFHEFVSVKASKNSIYRLNYEYTDTEPYKNGTYYRLKELNLDGSFKYTNTIFINANTNYDKFDIISVKPNPTNSNSSIKYSIPYDGNLHIELYDSYGTIVIEKDIQAKSGISEDVLHLEKLSTGIYYLRTIFDNDRLKTNIIIKADTDKN